MATPATSTEEATSALHPSLSEKDHDTNSQAQNSSPSTEVAVNSKEPEAEPEDFERGFRFWAIIFGLAISTLLASLEQTVVTTAAPHILQDLDMQENFIWITNSFFICAWVFLTIIALFTLGSGICGGATSGNMLIAGRAIQGAGSGGIVLTVNIIVSDLCPLRKRGQYMAVILGVFGIGVALGPFIGGVIADSTTWRWVFWINLPIGGLSLFIMFVFLQVRYKDDRSLVEKLRRIDIVGNAILMLGTVAILYSLTYAGTIYSWSSWHTLVPLLLGFFGYALFGVYEASGFAAEPVMPMRLLKHRTSIVVLINTFLNSIVYLWYLYYLPVYFQAVALYSSSRAGYSLIPQAIAGLPGAMLAAISLSRWGKFKPIHFIGFALSTMGMGLLSMVGLHTSVADWAVFQIITALGIGMVIDTLLPAFQAPASEQDQAMATTTWGFFRAFGSIWGVSIPAVIFNNRVEEQLHTVSDPRARQLLSGGGAYQQASAAFVKQFSPDVQLEVRNLYTSALDRSFWVGAIFAGAACLLVLVEREVPLRKQLETEYGLEKRKDNTQPDSERGLGSES